MEALEYLYRTEADHQQAQEAMQALLLRRNSACWQTCTKLLKHPLPFQLCEYRGCDQRATHRACLNIWGSLYEFDACEVHFTLRHGKWADSF